MRKVAIIGAGQAGLILGIGLVNAGYKVTLFSERTPEAILDGKPLGFPILFERALEIERQLGLNFWDLAFPGTKSVDNTFCDPEGNRLLELKYDLERPWQAIDQRLKFFHWIQAFVARGGEFVVQPMTVSQLEDCTQIYDLVVVAAGKGFLSTLFERDAQRSTHDQPARRVAGGIFTGIQRELKDALTLKLTVLPGIGEVIQIPFYSHSNPSYSIGFEAHPGSELDQFAAVQNAQELLGLSLKVMQQFHPWDYEAVQSMQLIDSNAWLVGAITPTVRKPIGKLPSGAIVMGIGDTVILNDPIAGQGANNANKMAHLVTQRIIEQGDRPFDAEWIQSVFEQFWLDSQHVNHLSNCLLNPEAHHQDIFIAAAHNPEVARDYFSGVNHPPQLFPWFFDPDAARSYLESKGMREAIADLPLETVLAASPGL